MTNWKSACMNLLLLNNTLQQTTSWINHVNKTLSSVISCVLIHSIQMNTLAYIILQSHGYLQVCGWYNCVADSHSTLFRCHATSPYSGHRYTKVVYLYLKVVIPLREMSPSAGRTPGPVKFPPTCQQTRGVGPRWGCSGHPVKLYIELFSCLLFWS